MTPAKKTTPGAKKAPAKKGTAAGATGLAKGSAERAAATKKTPTKGTGAAGGKSVKR